MDIINIGSIALNNYVLRTSGGCLAIDTGYAGNFDRYRDRLKKKNVDLKEIRFVFLTHAHEDHAGFLRDVFMATDAQVVLHREGPKRLALGQFVKVGGCPNVPAKAFFALLSIAGKGKHEFPVVDVAGRAIVWDGTSQPLRERGVPLDIVALPGHTADSIGLLSDDGDLFCGDAAMNGFPSVKRQTIWMENVGEYATSWDTIIAGRAKTIYPGHGRPFPVSDLTRFRAHLDRIVLR